MKLYVGFSPCPNDTFIFDALIHHKIDTEGLDFEVFIADVETLNQKAFQGAYDITKLSFHAYGYIVQDYVLLDSGAAIGQGVGPLLVARSEFKLQKGIFTPTVGIPGKYTTANLLLDLTNCNVHKKEFLFSAIEDAVRDGSIDMGLIIHESRFTYKAKGLKKFMDIGKYWERSTGSLVPLGGIAMRRNLPMGVHQKVNRLIANSIRHGLAHPNDAMGFVLAHAQEMSPEVVKKHINTYVNLHTVDTGEDGRMAIRILLDSGKAAGIIPEGKRSYFLPEHDHEFSEFGRTRY